MKLNENMELLLTSISELLGDMKMNVFKEKLEKVIAFPDNTSIVDFIEEYTKWSEKNYFKKERLFVFSNCSRDFDRLKLVLN